MLTVIYFSFRKMSLVLGMSLEELLVFTKLFSELISIRDKEGERRVQECRDLLSTRRPV